MESRVFVIDRDDNEYLDQVFSIVWDNGIFLFVEGLIASNNSGFCMQKLLTALGNRTFHV